MAKEFEKLHRNGARNAHLHLGWWCDRGYDNRRPDLFPIAPDADGTSGEVDLDKQTYAIYYPS